MTIEKRPENKATKSATTTSTTSDNQATFRPLGKYAVIAVIMVSIIVTTAIMLDKQLKSVEHNIASIEDQVTAAHSANIEANTDMSQQAITASAGTDTTDKQKADVTGSAQVTAADKATDMAQVEVASDATVTATDSAVDQVAETEAARSATASNNVSTPVVAAAVQDTDDADLQTTQAVVEPGDSESGSWLAEKALADDFRTRIAAHKQEQKQRMSEAFDRIEKLEAKQLDEYKISQEKRIERLREQVSQQQKVIDALIERDRQSLQMREASMEKTRLRREQMLNRI